MEVIFSAIGRTDREEKKWWEKKDGKVVFWKFT